MRGGKGLRQRMQGRGGMGRQRMLKSTPLTAALAALVLALPQRTEAFYLPGVAPYEYKDSEKVRAVCSARNASSVPLCIRPPRERAGSAGDAFC